MLVTLNHESESREDSMIETFNELALDLGLPELRWEFVHAEGETIVEGHPVNPTDLDACPRWAEFLGMQAIAAEPDAECCRWMGFNGRWTLAIVATV
jgi:hypothetical protein